jgi:hypothetical protein
MIGRELLNLIGCNINWVLEPAANCFRTGNHLGVQPHGFKDSIDFAVDELEEMDGVRVEAPINKKAPRVSSSCLADYFGTPRTSLLGYLMVLTKSAWITLSVRLGRRQFRPFVPRDDQG